MIEIHTDSLLQQLHNRAEKAERERGALQLALEDWTVKCMQARKERDELKFSVASLSDALKNAEAEVERLKADAKAYMEDAEKMAEQRNWYEAEVDRLMLDRDHWKAGFAELDRKLASIVP